MDDVSLGGPAMPPNSVPGIELDPVDVGSNGIKLVRPSGGSVEVPGARPLLQYGLSPFRIR